MKEHNLEAFYKYYSNATKEQAIEDMFLDNCNLQEEIERLQNIIKEAKEYIDSFNWEIDHEKREIKALGFSMSSLLEILDRGE